MSSNQCKNMRRGKKTTDELLPQHNYLKYLNDGTLSMQEIVMSTLDVLLAGIRNVSHKVIIVFAKQLPILLPTRTVKLLLPILLQIPYIRSLSSSPVTNYTNGKMKQMKYMQLTQFHTMHVTIQISSNYLFKHIGIPEFSLVFVLACP